MNFTKFGYNPSKNSGFDQKRGHYIVEQIPVSEADAKAARKLGLTKINVGGVEKYQGHPEDIKAVRANS